MNTSKIPKFYVIGISVRTSNENGQAAKDIPDLWNKFITESIAENIPNKIDNSIYSIYTEYEKDHTRPYTTLLGCRVENLDLIPNGMIGKTFDQATYDKIVAKGNLMQGIVYNEWVKIWNSDLDRTFVADFEVYGEKAQDPTNAEVEIFVGVKDTNYN
ncbi:MAG: effector binding domain-containing protein [Bacteroidia bacterium]|nr:effector binding domain-containing protein [Bacteroidia bacterium]MBP9923319.1 effector binding domain-containing protein [Bacteroidia bacterium]